MEKIISDLMNQARNSLSGNWGIAIATFIIFVILSGSIQVIPFFGQAGYILLAGPFAVGISIFSLNILRQKNAKIENLFDGFKDYGRSFITYLLMLVYIILWTLLLIIPGIVMALAYSLTFFILADDKTIRPKEAIQKSKQMMYGYKLKLFYLILIFFGLSLLCMLTLGIGFLWLIPFAYITMAAFYEDIKDRQPQQGK